MGWPFFFQAEDGIRDKLVTGVQTCALPICREGGERRAAGRARPWCRRAAARQLGRRWPRERSEERSVGKECKSRSSQEESRKKGDEHLHLPLSTETCLSANLTITISNRLRT